MHSAARPRRLITLAAFALLCSFALAALGTARASAAAGELDPSFGVGGTVRTFGGGETYVAAIAAQPDGGSVLAGYDQGKILVARLLENGSLDPSFGNAGVVTTPLPGKEWSARAVAIQPDGKIVVAGGVAEADTDVLVARYLTNGALDPTFSGDGIEVIRPGAGQDEPEAVAIGAGGRILITGRAGVSGGSGHDALVVVLAPNGEPDPAFAGTGYAVVETKADPHEGEGRAIAEGPDGALVVADGTGAGGGHGFTLLRLLPNGKLDPSFDGDGVVETTITGTGGGEAGRVTDLALQPDGRIVAVGYAEDRIGPMMTRDSGFAAARYLTNGQLDPSFGNGGTFTYQFDHFSGSDEQADTVDLTASGKIVLGGSFDAAESSGSFGLLRLDPAGALDPTFGSGGVVRSPFLPPLDDYLQAGTLDAQGRYLALSALDEGETFYSVVTRFLGDPPPAVVTPSVAAPATSPPPPSTPARHTPHAQLNPVPRVLPASTFRGVSGTATDADGDLARVQIALERIVPGGKSGDAAPAKGGKSCLQLKSARGRFGTARAKAGSPCPQRWLGAGGTAKWSFTLKASLPPGRYVVFARALDAAGGTETSFSRKAGDRYAFRLTAPK